ncbi:YtrH family sporulation protein [Effusibacillus consociatus]|uniref:YtrH family sporulation protein n=1 Tax=Effusibacillus consociatus TaxID=1117041 RepID=A0ABV9Q579_9BACL
MGFLSTIIFNFCVALGMVLGGSMVGALGAMLTHHPPMATMFKLADQLKIWALVAAIGGSVDALKIIGDSMWDFKFDSVAKQFAYLVSAFLGCQVGYYLVKWITAGRGI